MFAHAGQLCEGSDDGALATPRRGALGVAASMCGRRPIRRFQNKMPATDFSVRALQFSRWWRYAGDLPDMSIRFRMVNELQKNRRNGFDKLKRPRPIVVRDEKPAAVSGAGCTISSMMPMCP